MEITIPSTKCELVRTAHADITSGHCSIIEEITPAYELIYNASKPERFADTSMIYSVTVVMLKDEAKEKHFHGSTYSVRPNAKIKRTGDLLCGDFWVESISGNTVTFRPSGEMSYIAKTPR